MGSLLSDAAGRGARLVWMEDRREPMLEGQALLRRAAKSGDADAQCFLARTMLGKGFAPEIAGFAPDPEEAARLLWESVRGGSACGVLTALRCGALTPSVRRDMPFASPREAFARVALQAREGHPVCQCLIGEAYLWGDASRAGEGPRRRAARARLAEEWLCRALDAGVALAAWHLGRLYAGECGVRADPAAWRRLTGRAPERRLAAPRSFAGGWAGDAGKRLRRALEEWRWERDSATGRALWRERRAHALRAAQGVALTALGGAAGGMLLAAGQRAGEGGPAALAALLLALGAGGAVRAARAMGRFALERSELGRALLAQGESDLPGAMERIDEDIRRNGRWFGEVAVGCVWIVGDGAMRLERVRGVFSVTAGPLSQALCLVDGEGHAQATSMRRRGDLRALTAWLRRLLPQAASGGLEECREFLLRERRPSGGEASRVRKAPSASAAPARRALAVDGVLFWQYAPADVWAALEEMGRGACGVLALMRAGEGERELAVRRDGCGYTLLARSGPVPGGRGRRFRAQTGRADQVRLWLEQFEESGELPDLGDWTELTRRGGW